MGRIDRQPREQHAADQIAQRHGDLIPEPPCGQADVCAEHHADRHQKHVDHGMFKTLRKEQESRTPDRNKFSGQRRRHVGRDDGRLTIQLHNMPLVNAASRPAEP